MENVLNPYKNQRHKTIFIAIIFSQTNLVNFAGLETL